MPSAPGDKWLAFWLSFAVPGAGQLWAGRWSCLAYFATVAAFSSALPRSVSWFALVALGLASAEHAKRCLEAGKGRRLATAEVRSRGIERSGRGRRVVLRIELELARPAPEVWELMADFARFVTIDPFHTRVIVLGAELNPGVALALEHHAFGVRFLRFGRLLRWREGVGFVFSDLPARGGGRGFFPHVFDFAVTPAGPTHARLTVEVRGKWTSRRLPRRAGLWWFSYVFREHARLLKIALA